MRTQIHLKSQNGSFRIYTSKGNKNRMNQFLEAMEVRGLSLQTIRAYGYDLVFFLRWLQSTKIQWKYFTQKNLLSFIKYQRTINAKPKSINRRLTTCELYYKFCFNGPIKESIGVNKASPFYKGRGRDRHLGIFHISKPNKVKLKVKVPQPIVEILRPNDIDLFFKNINCYRNLAIFYFMLMCGLRFSEVLTMKNKNIDWGSSIIKIIGKGNKERMMPIPHLLIEILKKYMALEISEFSNAEFLFLNLKGKVRGQPMTKSGLRSLFRYRRAKTGVLIANPHRFRHTFGSRMAAENVSLPVLQRMMGHADITTTLQYIHLSTHDLAKEFHRATLEIEKDYVKK